MGRNYTEAQIRSVLWKVIGKQTIASKARELGLTPQNLYDALDEDKACIGPKVLDAIGFESSGALKMYRRKGGKQ